MKTAISCLLGILFAAWATADVQGAQDARYAIEPAGNSRVVLKTGETGEWPLDITFCVLFSEADPSPALRPAGIGVKYNIVTWYNRRLKTDEAASDKVDDLLSVGDGFDPRILKGSTESRTSDIFQSAPYVLMRAERAEKTPAGLEYTFPDHPLFTLRATVAASGEAEPPVLQYQFTPKAEGYYSIGYVGAPAYEIDAVDEIYQPLIWQAKRFPRRSFMTLAFRCTVPSALVTRGGSTLGIAVDPSEFPFGPLPRGSNSHKTL